MTAPYRGVWTDADIAEMNKRTQERREAAIKALGPKWLGYVRPKATVQTFQRRKA